MLTAPFAIVLDAVTFFLSAFRCAGCPQRRAAPRAAPIVRRFARIAPQPDVGAGWLMSVQPAAHAAGGADPDASGGRLSAGAIGIAYMSAPRLRMAAASAEQLSARLGSAVIAQVAGDAWQAFGLIAGSVAFGRRAGPTTPDFGAVRHHLALPVAGDCDDA
jgi:hypothetical protein